MITHHTSLLQALIDKHGLKSYLEIGVQNPANNFDKIICEYKRGCDPDLSLPDSMHGNKIMRVESDEFFKMQSDKKKWDLIFLDGLHEAKQIKLDFENSLLCLSGNGFIVIHDVLPENEEGTLIPRQTKKWWGTVYKFAMCIKNYALKVRTYNIDEGIMVIQKLEGISPNCILPDHLMQKAMDNITWEMYLNGRNTIMTIQREVII